MTSTSRGLVTLRRRSEFLRVRNGLRWSCASFVLEAKSRDGWTTAVPVQGDVARFGFTVTKKLGGAVERNRIRRRLRSALVEVAPVRATGGFDYVLIAREGIKTILFARLLEELGTALAAIHTRRPHSKPQRRGKP